MDNTPKRNKTDSFYQDMVTAELEGLDSPHTPSSPCSNTKQIKSGLKVTLISSSTQRPGQGSGDLGVGYSRMTESTIPQSPNMQIRPLPPTTPKSRASEAFLSPSLILQSPAMQPTPKVSENPIKEISYNLKTRLNYAFVKLQNGWQGKTLPELETELQTSGSPYKRHERLFEIDKHDSFQYNNKNSSVEAGYYDDHDEAVENSVRSAFLRALSTPLKKLKQNSTHLATPPRQTLLKSACSPSQNQPSEVEAIETLISLSTLQKQKPHSFKDSQNNNSSVQGSYMPLELKPYKNYVSQPQPHLPLGFPVNSSSQMFSFSSDFSDTSDISLKRALLVKPFGISSIYTEQHQHHIRHSETKTDVETDIEDSESSETCD